MTAVDDVRAFNRFYTRWVGALDAGLLGSKHALTDARLLFELARADVTAVATLRSRLAMDAGHLSRTLARLERRGLCERLAVQGDARRRDVALTAAGRAAAEDLDARSATHIAREIEHLDAAGRSRMLRAMADVRAALGDTPASRTVVLRGPEPGELGWIVAANGAVYAEQFGWDERYEALVAKIVADYAGAHDPSREAVWIAEVDGAPAGCVMCVRDDDATARLRLLLVLPSARGLGVGSRLVASCVAFARSRGYERLVLWTNDVLVAARGIYEREGFTLVSTEPHSMFGPTVTGQEWELAL